MGFSKWRPHPWHGLSPGTNPPSELNAFVELTSFDLMKYEIDKESGYLRVDRSLATSALPPALYGFVPQTLSGTRVSALMEGATAGDDDPLDICILSERPISRSEVVVPVNVVGGIPMLDNRQADDKIVSILRGDPVYGGMREIEDVPEAVLRRLVHYFSTYKPNSDPDATRVREVYGRSHAERVVSAAMEDYRTAFPI